MDNYPKLECKKDVCVFDAIREGLLQLGQSQIIGKEIMNIDSLNANSDQSYSSNLQ